MRTGGVYLGALVLAAVLAVAVAGGCRRYEKVVRYEPMLSGLPGAEVGGDVTTRGAKKRSEGPEVIDASEQTLRVEREDGSVVLVSKTGRQLMAHVYTTLANNEADLFVEQVLSEMSKKEFAREGVDPREGFEFLRQNQAAIRALFNRIPMGEFTPGVFMRAQGNNVFRLGLQGIGARGLSWTFMDMVFEHGGWRLRWFG